MAAGCGCVLGGSPTLIGFLDQSTYIINHSDVRTWSARWEQPTFPASPCTDPHNIRWQWRQIHPITTGYSVPGSIADTDCSDIKAKAINLGNGGSVNQLANAATWYDRDFFACEEGIYQLRVRRNTCGAGFHSATKDILVRVRRLHSNL